MSDDNENEESFEQQKLEMSLTLGAPVDGLIDKLNKVGPLLDAIFRFACDTPREKMVLLGMYACVATIKNSEKLDGQDAHEAAETAVKAFGDMLPAFYELLIHLGVDWIREAGLDN